MNSNFPIVRLELQRMQHSIMACLLPALEAEKQTIEALIADEIAKFDFASECRAIIYRELRACLDEAIRSAIHRSYATDEVRSELDRMAKNHVRMILEAMQL